MCSLRTYSPGELPERFRRKITINPDTGCWEWTGARDRGGYGSVNWEGSARGAHRVVYTLLVGQVPGDLELDHVRARGCVFRHCVNPGHLEPVTVKVNRQRQRLSILTALNAAKTHCSNGHEFTEENTRIRVDGARECKTCSRLKTRKAYRKNAALIGRGPANATKTHCKYGHPFDEENTYVNSIGRRTCRACHREQARKAYQERSKK